MSELEKSSYFNFSGTSKARNLRVLLKYHARFDLTDAEYKQIGKEILLMIQEGLAKYSHVWLRQLMKDEVLLEKLYGHISEDQSIDLKRNVVAYVASCGSPKIQNIAFKMLLENMRDGELDEKEFGAITKNWIIKDAENAKLIVSETSKSELSESKVARRAAKLISKREGSEFKK